jgi:glucose/arabinose dehydrogenase
MDKRWLWGVFGGAALIGAGCVTAQNQQGQNAAWRVETVKGGLERPWSLNFAPDGRLFYTTRNTGELQALNVSNGAISRFQTSLPNFRPEGEGGMLGMELAPDFAQSGRVFVCYSYWRGTARGETDRRNRLSSFTINGASLGNEKILLDDMLGWWNHNGCRVVLSPDKTKLFVSMGDAANFPPGPRKALDLENTAGKTFRINLDGSVPSDNPFPNSAVWTLGHRNHQGLAFHPTTGALWSTEHGPERQDELNVIKKGKNYGWPTCQGTRAESPNCTVENYEPAIRSYDPQVTVAMSGMTFYTGNVFAAWKNDLFFVTLKTGRIYRLELDGEKIVNQEIMVDGDYGRLRDITVGPDGFVYFSTDAGGNSSIMRIRPR